MTRGPVSFKETDVARAVRSAVKAGLQVVGVEISPKTGNITVHVGAAANDNKAEAGNPWDEK
jgi:hypothetical protein